MDERYNCSFRCFFGGEQYTAHYQSLTLAEIPKWIECYRFTHPTCTTISFKIWFTPMEEADADK